MAFHLPFPATLPPPPTSGKELLEVAASDCSPPSSALVLRVRASQADFTRQSAKESGALYCAANPVPLVAQRPAEISDARPPSTAWAVLIAGRSQHHLPADVVLQLESSDRLRFLQALKDGAGSNSIDAWSGPLRPKRCHGPGRSSGDPTAAWSGALTQEKRIAARR